MRNPLAVFILLMVLMAPAAHPLENTPELLRDLQRTSLIGLASVNLQSLALTAEPSPEAMLALLEEAVLQAGLRVESSSRGLIGKPPYLRLATTWNSFHTGVASSPEEASLEIQQHVRDLSQELTSDIQALQSPHWVGNAIGMYPDGSMKCVEYDSKVTRKPRPPG